MSTSLWDFVRARAVEIHVGEHLRQRLERGDKLRVKAGFDPTAPDIHVGHLVLFDVLRRFQDEGHTVVFIVGDFTAQIGDPSGKSETRPVLSKEAVERNAQTYFEQASLVLDRSRIEVHGNASWLEELAMADVLRLLGKATLQQVLQREDFADRLKEGSAVGAHEILYPFNQAYDSVAVRADVEIGGTDQLFNLLFGREIQRAYGQEPQDIAVFPLLEGLDGVQKMSKSLGNYIGVAEPPEQIFGKAMSIPDALTEKYARLVCDFEPAELARVLSLPPRDAKATMASQLVRRLRGDEAAAQAEEEFVRRFVRHELPSEIPESSAATTTGLLKSLDWSSAQIRDAYRNGAVKIDGSPVGEDTPLPEGAVVMIGKRRVFTVKRG